MQKHNPELNRLPETRAKLDETFTKIADLDAQAAEQRVKYEDIINHPLSRTIGVAEARGVMSRAISDPRQMNKLIDYTRETQGEKGVKSLVKYVMDSASPYTNGEYDPRKLIAL